MLCNGYTKAKIQDICKSLGITYSESAMQTLEELILTQLEYFKTRSLPSEMFAVFIDAYAADIMENNKLQKNNYIYCSRDRFTRIQTHIRLLGKAGF